MELRARSWLAAVAVLACAGLPFEAGAEVVSPVRIGEVYAVPFGLHVGNQIVEIVNLGETPVDLSGWRFRSGSNHRVLPAGVVLDAGEMYLIHVAADGVNTPGDFYTGSWFPALNRSWDSLALYVPGMNWNTPGEMRDFVQWGAPGLPMSADAESVGLWDAEQYCPPVVTQGVSLQYCAENGAHGASGWDHGLENIGSYNGCLTPPTPVEPVSWGAIKSRFSR